MYTNKYLSNFIFFTFIYLFSSCIHSVIAQSSDLCGESTAITIGTCGFPVDINSTFNNNEGLVNPACVIPTITRDGWLSFNSTVANQRIGLSFESFNKDAAIAVYSGTCGALTVVSCANNLNGVGEELMEFTATTVGTYHIRVMNIEDNTTLNGSLCLYQVFSRNNCTDLATAPALSTESCNIQLNVLGSFSNSVGDGASCVNNNSPAAWVKFTATSDIQINIDYVSDNPLISPRMVIYNASGFTCGAAPVAPASACVTGGVNNTISLSTVVTNGATYFLKIVNPSGPASDMLGKLCIYPSSTTRPPSRFFLARTPTLNACAQFNVLNYFGGSNDGLNSNPNSLCIASGVSSDAWVKFENVTTPPPIYIDYDNQNSNAGTSDDAALVVYKGENITYTPTSLIYQDKDCLGTELVAANEVITGFTVTTAQDFGIPVSGTCAGTLRGDNWIRHSSNSIPFTVAFFNANQSVGIEVYEGACNTGQFVACTAPSGSTGFTSITIDNPVGVYFIRIKNLGTADLVGDVGVFTYLTPILCKNDLEEGIESFAIDSSIPDFEPNKTYYVRVANVSGQSNAIFGNLCVRNQEILPTDLCTTALILNTEDCGISLPIPLNLDRLPTNAATALCTASPKTIARDAWVQFTASSSNTTIEYLNTSLDGSTEDVILAVYRGSCGNNQTPGTLVLESCVDNLGDELGIEVLQVNTIPGLQYFVRVMTPDATALQGRICIQKTNQVNVCEEANLKTLLVNDCNYRFDVPADFTNNGSDLVSSSSIALSVSNPSARDGWLRMLGNGGIVTLQYQNNSEVGQEASNPAIVVYTAVPGPIDCGNGVNGAGNPINEILYVNGFNDTNKQTETVNFSTNAGQVYFIRLIDLALAPANSRGMTGVFCLSPGNQTYNQCATALPVEVGECNIALNVTDRVNTFNGPIVTCSGNLITQFNDAWAVVTTPAGLLPDNNLTIQYTNNTGNLNAVSDIAVAVYTITDCANPAIFTLISCVDDITVTGGITDSGIESINIPINAAAGNETFYIRIINKTAQNTAFGKLCLFYGNDIAEENCALAADYGGITGEWRSIEIPGTWTSTANLPSTDILDPPCVIPGGSNPTSANPPIRSQGWFRFTPPDNAPGIPNETGIVTIQYDNDGFVSGNPENAAIAVYSVPNGGIPNCNLSTFNGPSNADARLFSNPGDYSDANGLYLLGCSNSVWEGTESLSIPVIDGRTYYVRVMNVANRVNPNDMPGRIRIFPFARCTEGIDLVKDGSFQNWGAVNTSSNPSPTAYGQINGWIHPNPEFANFGAAAGVGQSNLEDVVRFATSYGYLKDEASSTATGAVNSHAYLNSRRTELGTEGYFTVTHTANTYKGNWFCYGRGYSGYGGNPATSATIWNNTYCAAGGGGIGFESCNEICIDYIDGSCDRSSAGVFSAPTNGSPAILPSTAEANFMLLNGLWTDPSINPDAAKVWCQTIERPNASQGSVGYYVFRAWFQNVKSSNQSGDVPQLKVTICDMANPVTSDIPPPSEWTTLTPATGATSILPGTTKTSGLPNEGTNPSGQTIHLPTPTGTQMTYPAGVSNGNMTIPADGAFRYEYGAAMSCNAVGEANNTRLKTLGSSFFIEQDPDTWQLMRCIYRAPAAVIEFNLCIENESLSKNGNDFAIDDISMNECINADADAFDRLLRGDACELADDGEFLGVPQNFTLIDFSGRLINDKILLDWITVQEVGIAYFDVERSINGRDFTKIGQVDATGNSEEAKVYSFIDARVPENVGFVYYRLKVYDQTEKFTNTSIIQINIQTINNIEVTLFPNPIESGEVATMRFKAPQDRASILITDIMGNHLFEQSFITAEGENEVELNTKGLSQGIYLIRLMQGNRRTVRKMVIR
jgi:hypothetical protein